MRQGCGLWFPLALERCKTLSAQWKTGNGKNLWNTIKGFTLSWRISDVSSYVAELWWHIPLIRGLCHTYCLCWQPHPMSLIMSTFIPAKSKQGKISWVLRRSCPKGNTYKLQLWLPGISEDHHYFSKAYNGNPVYVPVEGQRLRCTVPRTLGQYWSLHKLYSHLHWYLLLSTTAELPGNKRYPRGLHICLR